MAPKRIPIPLDFASKFIELERNFKALADHYGVDEKVIRYRWAPEITGQIKEIELEDLPKGRPAEMLEERDLDPDEWMVRGLRVNEWEMAGDLQRQTRLDIVPRKQMLRPARPDGWKRQPLPPAKKQATRLIAICGDQHAPDHDRAFHKRFCAWLRDHQPDEVIILGDLLENADVSRWEDRDGQATAQDSINAAYLILRDYIDAAPNAIFKWCAGNHDERVESYANKNAPKLAGVSRAEEQRPVLSIPFLVRLDELGVEYVGGYPLAKIILAPNLAVIHGSTVKRGAGASALANLEKRGYSVISGHTHRAGIVFKTVLDIDDSPSTLMAGETGTMKEIKPEVFDAAPDWQNAFLTCTIWKDGQFHLEPGIYSANALRWRDKRY